MAKNYQVCNYCGAKLTKDYRMQLMMGPKGFRSYPVCVGQCKKHIAKKGQGKRVSSHAH